MKSFMFACFVFFSSFIYAQRIKQIKEYKHRYNYECNIESIVATDDKKFVCAGSIKSLRKRGGINHGGTDLWVSKITKRGKVIWSRRFGGSDWEKADYIQQTEDGGFIIGGESNSRDGDVIENHGETDIWILKLSGKGKLEWARVIGSPDDDQFYSIEQAHDGGYQCLVYNIARYNSSISKSENHQWGYIKLDEAGEIISGIPLGNNHVGSLVSVDQTRDSGYIAASIRYNTGAICHDPSKSKYSISKVSNTGDTIWNNEFSIFFSAFNTILNPEKGKYILVGYRRVHNPNDVGWVYKTLIMWLNEKGEKVKQKFIKDSDLHYTYEATKTKDAGIIIPGCTRTIKDSVQIEKTWLMKLLPNAEVEWVAHLDSSIFDRVLNVQETFDGGFVVVRGNFEREPWAKKDLKIDCISKEGKLAWSKVLSDKGDLSFYTMALNAKHGLIVANHKEYNKKRKLYTSGLRIYRFKMK